MEESEYERQRQQNILKNQALIRELQLDTLKASLNSTIAPVSSKSRSATPKPKSRSKPKAKKEPVENVPRRTSSRLAGLPADSEVAKRKAEEQEAARYEAQAAKRQRVAGDLKFEIGGEKDWEFPELTEEDVKATKDVGLKEVRERFLSLRLYEHWEPNRIRICQERIYCMEFHPRGDRPVIFAGDKVGNFGIFDASQTRDVKEDDDDDDGGGPDPEISAFKLHSRTISALLVSPSAPTRLLSASYDSSVRTLDLPSGKSTESIVLPGTDEAFSSVQYLDANVQTLLFATLEGQVGRKDLRTRPEDIADLWGCSEKKIGGIHCLPGATHIFASASLDRTVKLWDLRMIDKELNRPHLIAEHTSRLSVSATNFSATGTLATTSYDDTVKFYDCSSLLAAEKGPTIEDFQPKSVVRHNNQTGRWVTILRPIWQEAPTDGRQKCVVANMNRGIDVMGEAGEMIAQLGNDERVTAVPAVARMHRSRDWVVGGTGSGKVVLYM